MTTHAENKLMTQNLIYDSFWKHYTKMPIEKITVNMIVEDAGIHRSTFYRHFADVYEVLEKIEDDTILALESDVNKITSNISNLSVETFSSQMIKPLMNHADKLYFLLNRDNQNGFFNKFKPFASAYYRTINHLDTSNAIGEYYEMLFTNLMVTNFKYWYEHQRDYSLAELSIRCQPIIKSIVACASNN